MEKSRLNVVKGGKQTIEDLINYLEKLYPNDIFKIAKLSEIELNKYIAKLEIIEIIKNKIKD